MASTKRSSRKSNTNKTSTNKVNKKTKELEKDTTEVTESTNETNVTDVKEQENVDEITSNEKQENSMEDLTTIDKSSPAYISKVIKEAKTLDELLDKLKDSEPVKSYANRISVFRKRRINAKTEDDHVSANYNLYMLMKEIIEKPDYGTFAAAFDLLNKVFLLGEKGLFNEIELSKYDYRWKWSKESHQSYHMLVQMLVNLANPKKRRNNKRLIDVTKIPNISSTGIQNLIRYYNLGQ